MQNEGNESGKTDDDGKVRMRQQIMESLHKEMEVTGYAKGKSGQLRKKVPRKESLARTKKRKRLERADEQDFAIHRDEETNRLRGSKAAIEDHIIEGSIIFQNSNKSGSKHTSKADSRSRSSKSGGVGTIQESDSDSDSDGDEMDGEAEGNDTDVDNTHKAVADPNQTQNNDGQGGGHHAKKTGSQPPSARRRMYRLRNFQSFRMAQRHGAALAAHAKGQPLLAIEKLKQVARDAPSAPQVYSSLGMVYGDMLKDAIRRSSQGIPEVPHGPNETATKKSQYQTVQTSVVDEKVPNPGLAEQLDLAKKSYGSYHVAAILCKKDFTLWVRAADSALGIAELHGKIMILPELSREVREYHSAETKRWYSEALRDFTVADNLKPPGIDVPAKLAFIHMELGNFSEALTILTGLKNRSTTADGSRGEFQSSYKAWLLYADLMLKIGHECLQWNKGIQSNDNYMFRRWLRKLSLTFDWQERRLHALALAFEAAAGSFSAQKFLTWMRERAARGESKNKTSEGGVDESRWHFDTNRGTAGKLKKREKRVDQSLGHDKTESSEKQGSKAPGNTSAQSDPTSKKPPAENTSTVTIDSTKAVSDPAQVRQLEVEKEIIEKKNKAELEAFDRTTTDMNIYPESVAAKDREVAREALVKSHENAIAALSGEYGQETQASSSGGNDAAEEEKFIAWSDTDIPITASCHQVCSIASILMKHLHGLELYTGVRLVGEGVSAYFKERARRYDKRAAARRKADEWAARLATSPFILDSNDDTMNDDDDDSTSDASIILSDDDGMDDTESTDLLPSLRRGTLPPELRVLYGLALIGEGGRNLLAAKSVEAINDLDQEDASWLSGGDLETEFAKDPLSSLFQRAMTEPLTRSAAYAFLADVLRKTRKELDWSSYFSPLLRRHLTDLQSNGLMDELLKLQDERLTPYMNFRKNQLLKIILATCRFDINSLEYPGHKNPIFDRRVKSNVRGDVSVEKALSTADALAKILHLVWKVDNDGSLPPISSEFVKIFSRCLRWVSVQDAADLSYSTLCRIHDVARRVVSYISRTNIRDLKAGIDGGDHGQQLGHLRDKKWTEFPISTEWQAPEYRPISLSIYNLSVACSVSLFSGWESEEFTLKLLRRCYGNKHFGIRTQKKRVTGILPPGTEERLEYQWNEVATFLPEFPVLEFQKRLAMMKSTDWYQKEKVERRQFLIDQPIATFAEEEGIVLYLSFSALCLRLAGTVTNEIVRDSLLKTSLSILLPVTQFCLDELLWNSDIGEAASSLAGFDEWRLVSGVGPSSVLVTPTDSKASRRRKRKADRAIEKKVQEWINGSDRPTLSYFVALPTRILRRAWMDDTLEVGDNQESKKKVTEEDLESAKESMRRVHAATTQLRACFTELAIEKASLQVAVALLDLCSKPTCHDPFLCLQQAASFASQASKAGNGDVAFRQSLPARNECTPLQALTILGRADCLHSVYFPNEAAFLCSYVARICRLHRDRESPEFVWNVKWKIVAIYAYNVSVMIRNTVSKVLDRNMQRSFLTMWERDVVEELERGRSEGLSWKRNLHGGGVLLPDKGRDTADHEEYYDDVMELDVDEEDVTEDIDAQDDDELSVGGKVGAAAGSGDSKASPNIHHDRHEDSDTPHDGLTRHHNGNRDDIHDDAASAGLLHGTVEPAPNADFSEKQQGDQGDDGPAVEAASYDESMNDTMVVVSV